MANIVSVTHRNVCKDGFTVVDKADSVFLDLPAPWSAVQHAKNALRKDRTTRICCFSPCMEQVLRTVSALNEAGFSDITMYETLLRPHEVHTTPRLPTVGEASARLKDAMARREAKRLQQVAAAQLKRVQKRKRDSGGDADDQGDQDADVAGNAGAEAAKKLRVDEKGEMSNRLLPAVEGTEGAGKIEERMDLDEGPAQPEAVIAQTTPSPSQPQPPSQTIISKVTHEVRGHTSYLTFATLEPVLGIASNVASLAASITVPEPSQDQ